MANSIAGQRSGRGRLVGRLTMPRSYPSYAGTLQVTPKAFEDQVLATANKLLTSDIVVNKIPYFETENEFKGNTAYIAEEV